MKKTLFTILLIALAFTFSSCKRSNVDDPPVDGPPGFSILLDGSASPNVLLVDGSRHSSSIRVRASDTSNNPLVGKSIVFLQYDGSSQVEWGIFENMASTIQKVTNSEGVATATFFGPTTLMGTQMYIVAQMAVEGSTVPKNSYILMYLSRPNAQNSAPFVNIAAPLNNATVSGVIPVIVQAADESGLATVDCYVDGVSLGSQPATAASIYTFSMDCSKYSNGRHTIEAVAYDKMGLRGADTAMVNVNNINSAVSVSITAPAANATVSGADVAISALAIADSSISRVDCYIDNNLIGSLTSGAENTYTFSWNSSLVANGIHAIKVIAFDSNNVSAQDTINVIVNNGSGGPEVNITAPAENAVLSGNIAISALATADSGIDKVECYVDNQLIDSLPGSLTSDEYAFSFASTQVNNGRHTIRVTAYDKKGTSASDSIEITVNNSDAAPDVEIIYPLNNSTINLPAGDPINIRANATDDKGVTRVALYINGLLQANMRKSGALYTFDWLPPQVDGTYTLYAIAYDTLNQATQSAAVRVTININNNLPPVVTITSPGNGATLSGTVTITALATADRGLARVEFEIDNVLVLTLPGSLTSDTYTYSWNTTAFSNGPHTIDVTAFDTTSDSTEASTVTVTVDNTAPPVRPK